ncbi:MerR family DNA-binding protein [Sphingobium fuliginis]|uniref:MerR family DNA-binding protein n=1 Tax=Sphingobium fuliginis (strain ATCC 27551) TaxID=336203 RepID=UPI001FCBF85B|nr:MerR family DNA-binding protein [Sphingobium fuliginis]
MRISACCRTMRTASGRRIYGTSDVRRLAFTRQLRGLGFSIEEICSLLASADAPDQDCASSRHCRSTPAGC